MALDPHSAAAPIAPAAEADETLMMRYQNGELPAFELLYRRHKDALYRFMLRGCQRPEIAADLFQDVWAQVVRAKDHYEVRAKFTTWLYQIARNRLIDHWRSAPRSAQSLDDVPDSDPALTLGSRQQPDEQTLQRERLARLNQALSSLPDEQREAFLLHEEGELSLEEIAELTGVGRETVKSRLRYALAKLREALKEERSHD